MKKSILTSIFCLTALLSIAQVQDNLPWCPPGATWVYKSFTATEKLYYKFEYETDSIIDGKLSKVLGVHQINFYGFGDDSRRVSKRIGEEYLYVSNDSLFWFDKIQNEFTLIYNFSLKQGDSFQTSNSRVICKDDENYPKEAVLSIDSTYTHIFGDRIFSINVTSNDGPLQWGGIIKNIGSLTSPFPQVNKATCDDSEAEYGIFYEELVCYSDNQRGSVLISANESECEKIATKIKTQTARKYDSNEYLLYPNPASDILYISPQELIVRISVININGAIVLDRRGTDSFISVSDLPSGVYIVRILDNKNNIIHKKFVKK